MTGPQHFSYDLAFDRNIGWLTEWEQQALRGKCVAIAGMGGVGGGHLLTLARFGIGAFHIADFDRFDIVNFNRQAGATTDSIGCPKVEVLARMARGINPELRLTLFDQGINPDNIDAFLAGADLFVDGLDFFALDIRRRIFARCAALGIPAVTAAPIGMGVGFLAFVPKGMSFERYFQLEGQSETEQYLRFLMGVAPRGLHRAYLVDPTRVDIPARKGPSTIAACQLCAGVTAVAAIKLLLGRGGVRPAPVHHHFDPYRGRLLTSRLAFGNAGPLQRAKLAVARRIYATLARKAATASPPFVAGSVVEEILNMARWAPSGDNVQPWRFELIGEESVVIHLRNEHAANIYEYRGGEPTLLSCGMLLANMRIAATAWRRRMEWHCEGTEETPRIIARFPPAYDIDTADDIDPLCSYIPLRSVDRRPYRLRALTTQEKSLLRNAVGNGLALSWHEDFEARWAFSRLGAQATDIRLRAPEAFHIHQKVIDWQHKHSTHGIPAGAVGMARSSLPLLRWAMRDWSRMNLLNRFGGTWLAAAQLDYAPGFASSAFFTIRMTRSLAGQDGRVARLLQAGEEIERFWLTAASLGLAVQPTIATLAFAHYGETGEDFTKDRALLGKARSLAGSLKKRLGAGIEDVIFIGRVGEPRARLPMYRSTRHSLEDLIRGSNCGQHSPTGEF